MEAAIHTLPRSQQPKNTDDEADDGDQSLSAEEEAIDSKVQQVRCVT